MTSNWPYLKALSDAEPMSFWLDHPARPHRRPALDADIETDLVIVGGGYTGLWAAIQAKEDDPDRDVVLIEADAIAEGASGQNMGALVDSLTHGISCGRKHFPRSYETLAKLGRENCDDLLATLDRYGIDAQFEPTGILYAAHSSAVAQELRAYCEKMQLLGQPMDYIDRDAMRAEIHSDSFWGALVLPTGRGILHPGLLAWGLRDAALRLGVRIHESTPMTGLSTSGVYVEIRCPLARVRARRAIMATNAFQSPVGPLRRRVIPIWMWMLMTEPLSHGQMESIGWSRRQGMGHSNEAGAHMEYRLTQDNRMLVGGGGAAYYYSSGRRPKLGVMQTHQGDCSRMFFETFPQLEGLAFTHRWTGMVGMTTTTLPSFGKAAGGRVAGAAGYSGNGVNASRFGASVALALAGMGDLDLRGLDLVRKAPFPWPPEPIRWLGIQSLLAAMNRTVRSGGRKHLWLRVLARLGFARELGI